jgi:EAL domain-containing protein (putative c-di-GMP-specific phosphodiesterase class I)
MAFHPILDLRTSRVWGYEALVRGTEGQSAGHILSQVDDTNRYKFDQACRVKAIELAGDLFAPEDDTRLSINFMPNAVYEPSACIRATLDAARRFRFNPKRIMFEFTENERMADTRHVERIIAEYKRLGFVTAIDDFGAGYAGLSLLANFQPDVIKIDMDLIRGIAASPARQGVITGIMAMANALDLTVIAEGIETQAELETLRSAGVRLFQGYLFARPAVETLPPVVGFSG